MKLFPSSSLTSLCFVLTVLSLGCHADTFECPNSDKPNSDRLQYLFAKHMKKVLGRNIYDVSGVFYDQKQRLTVSLASNKIVLERLNVTAFKEGLLDIYGPSVLLSQIKANQAEKLMLKTENRANRKAKMRGERPPSGAEMDKLIKRAILSDEQLLNDVNIAFVSAKFAFEELYNDYERLVPKLFSSIR